MSKAKALRDIEEARNTPAVAAHLDLVPEGEQEPLVLPGPVPPPPPRYTRTSPPTSATCLTQADLSRKALKRRSATASHFIITFNLHLRLNSHAVLVPFCYFKEHQSRALMPAPWWCLLVE